MKIGIGDPDVPRDQTVRSDFNPFVRHNERAVQQGEITNDGRAIKPEGKRTPGVNGDVIAEAESMRGLRFHKTTHWRCSAIKPCTKIDIGRQRMAQTIAFY